MLEIQNLVSAIMMAHGQRPPAITSTPATQQECGTTTPLRAMRVKVASGHMHECARPRGHSRLAPASAFIGAFGRA